METLLGHFQFSSKQTRRHRQQAGTGRARVQDCIDTMTIEAWYMDDDTATDQRLPHRQSPNAECTSAALEKIGTNAVGFRFSTLSFDVVASCFGSSRIMRVAWRMIPSTYLVLSPRTAYDTQYAPGEY